MNRITGIATQTEFGLVAWLDKTRVRLPLKGVECRFAARGDLLSIEMDQIFHQDNSQPLDCLYTFPLPGGAAIYRCELHVNGRVIRAKVEEEDRARELAREKKAEGYRTALVEMDRENLFNLSLGNVQPGDLVIVRLAYFQTLTRLEDWTSFHIPFCPGVRYIPGTPLLRAPRGKGVMDDTDQVPDASRISPPRIDKLHRDAAYLSVEGTVASGVKDISSPSHPVLVRDCEGHSMITIADRAAVPDCDFVLRWTEVHAPDLSLSGWRSREGQDSFALLRLRAPADADIDHGYSQDVYFLVDRSGSMQGMKWTKAAQALREFLKTLGPRDRVWATFFESSYRDLAEQPLAAAQLLADPAVQQLEKLGTDGGTELLPALEHVLAKVAEFSSDRPASLMLITDGQVANEKPILSRLADYPKLPVHAFGIDTAVNDAFLKETASQQRGTVHLVTPNDDIPGAVARLGRRLRRPVLTALQVNEPWELAGGGLPDAHAGEFISVSLKGPASAGEVVLSGTRPNGEAASYRIEPEETQEPALALLWRRQRIRQHLSKGKRKAAIALAKASNLVCDGTAFVAWDETEKVAVAAREIYQPAMQVMYQTVLGATAGAGKMDTQCLLREPFGRIARSVSLGDADKSDPLRAVFDVWKGQISAIFFDVELAAEFFDVLREWLLANRAESEDRLEKLLALLTALHRSSLSRTSRLKTLREWLEAHLQEPELRRKALDRLRAIESSADALLKS